MNFDSDKAQTIRPPKRISQRVTVRIPKLRPLPSFEPHIPWYQKYLGLILVVFIVLITGTIVLFSHPAHSTQIQENIITPKNEPVITEPSDLPLIKSAEPVEVNKTEDIKIKKVPPKVIRRNLKNDLINPY